MTVLNFPVRPDTNVADGQVSIASLISVFLAYSLPGLQDIAGLILTKLEAMDDEALMAIYHAVYGDITNGPTSTEMVMLDEIVSEEVARRCALNGWPPPWEDAEQIVADNDQPEPEGAA